MKIFIILPLFVVLLSSCSKNIENNINYEKKTEIKNEQNKTIYTSFYPIYFLTKELVGNNAKVINLLPSGGEPHEYEPTLKQIEDLGNSSLILLNGLGIESYEKKLEKNLDNKKIIKLGENLDNLIKIDENNFDPHIWLSPKLMKKIGENLKKELENSGYKNINISILNKLDSLDKKYTNETKNCERNTFITSHKAFGYLARDYGLNQYAVLGISPEEEPSASDIAKVIEIIKKEKFPIIFSEEGVSQKFFESIKEETNSEILFLNPIETLKPEDEKNKQDYISLMGKNLELLKKGLGCK